jgi:hypothetical protein
MKLEAVEKGQIISIQCRFFNFISFLLLTVKISPFYRYPEARALTRKIIFHAGPTNSGKTFQALQRFLSAGSGVYCGPLKLLAVEVFNKSNEKVFS